MQEVLVHARKLAEFDPDNGYPHRLMAAVFHSHRHFGEVREAYRTALDRQLGAGVCVRVLSNSPKC